MPCTAFLVFFLQSAFAIEWRVPVAGNAYRTAPEAGRLPIDRDGALHWQEPSERYTIYFRVDRPATLRLALEAAGPSEIEVGVLGQAFPLRLKAGAFSSHPVTEIKVPGPRYLAVSLQGNASFKGAFGRVRALRVESETKGLKLDFVASGEKNMFYWGRRGPSVHLGYQLPPEKRIEYAYSEITVPEGMDPPGSYFMANGFGEGYFGIQVRGGDERWILFSVWSPYPTDHPDEIPPEQTVKTLSVGEGVINRSFGGEGSGGQSFLVYPWQTGMTYRFLTQVRPDGAGNTDYTAWFSEKGGEWRLIASFRRPKTDTWYSGFHSFLENFLTSYGHDERRSHHANQWVCDSAGRWSEITRARFTADRTGSGGHRLDFAGGSEEGYFYLRNGGFFSQPAVLGTWLERRAVPENQPEIDFEALPR